MEFKLFGKSLFSVNGDGNPKAQFIYNGAADQIAKSTHLPNFYTMSQYGGWGGTFISISEASDYTEKSLNTKKKKGTKKTKAADKPVAVEITPKGVYHLKLLNDESFTIKVDPAYIEDQLADFKDKLGMIKSAEWDMNRGTVEISSMIIRLENRKKYPDFKEFFEQFPYTTTARMNDLVAKHTHLKVGEVEQFLADMPKEAVTVMKEYTAKTQQLCDKKPLYYIIANKKDFEKTEKRRDPILLAQSPFGHFWQILGAWDEEMLLIEEL